MEPEGSLLFDVASRCQEDRQVIRCRPLPRYIVAMATLHGIQNAKGDPFRIACVDIASIGGCGGSQYPILATDRKSRSTIGGVEPLPSEGKGHTFESCRVRHNINDLA
jgi:hypothetical protein